MVQPALIVVNKSGNIQQMWSWNTEPLEDVCPKEEMTIVPAMGGASLVSIRPYAEDLAASIRENRSVELKGKSMLQMMIEMPKVKNFAEFKGTMIRIARSLSAIVKSKFPGAEDEWNCAHCK